MNPIPPGRHAGSVTATGWRRENYILTSRYSFTTDDEADGALHVFFIASYKKNLFRTKRTLTIGVMPGFGAGYDDKYLVYLLKADRSLVKFTARICETPHGSSTYGISHDAQNLLDEFFATQTNFQFEVHGPEGAIFELPMINAPQPYAEMTAAIKASTGF
jgi:hypothetical protein